jgi:thiamine phosphate synthase YjbQ (UPF0047 family)
MYSRKRCQDGLVLVNAMHITASVFINDGESGLHHDYGVWLEIGAARTAKQYRQNDTGEDSADAHQAAGGIYQQRFLRGDYP